MTHVGRHCRRADMRIIMDINTVSESQFMGDYMNLTCLRRGTISELHNRFHFAFDVSWDLSSHVANSGFINSFNIAKVIVRLERNPATRLFEEIPRDEFSQGVTRITVDVCMPKITIVQIKA